MMTTSHGDDVEAEIAAEDTDDSNNNKKTNQLLRLGLMRAKRTLEMKQNTLVSTADDDNVHAKEVLDTLMTSLSMEEGGDDDKDDDDTKKNDNDDLAAITKRLLIPSVIKRSHQTLTTSSATTATTTTTPPSHSSLSPLPSALSYLSQPSITVTALAHTLWSTIINPWTDVAIDATCGNGQDASYIASLLFPPSSVSATNPTNNSSRLLCLDVQKLAVERTSQVLRDQLGDDIFDSFVTVDCRSHDPLLTMTTTATTRQQQSVGLICYNLGYLPSSSSDDNNPIITTSMESTLYSLVRATQLIRVGGMISVITYPKTNRNEDIAVKLFMEGLGLMSGTEWKKKGRRRGLEDFLDDKLKTMMILLGTKKKDDDDYDDDEERVMLIKRLLEECLGRVLMLDGYNDDEITKEQQHWTTAKTAWRVMSHQSLGRDLSPILITAVRIK